MEWMAPGPGIAMCNIGCYHRVQEAIHEAEIATVVLDLAKSVLRVHAVYSAGVFVRRQVRRAEMLLFFSRLAPCLMGKEACANAHHRSRELAMLGHDVRLIPPSCRSSPRLGGARP
ncbi:hypothetical protein [Rhodobacter sp. CZR27]|uniref:hypothetical protein n=1 Tax=Rhodobacter sp. CZR27 TaxID=2033869 RepID=UPI0012FD4553